MFSCIPSALNRGFYVPELERLGTVGICTSQDSARSVKLDLPTAATLPITTVLLRGGLKSHGRGRHLRESTKGILVCRQVRRGNHERIPKGEARWKRNSQVGHGPA